MFPKRKKPKNRGVRIGSLSDILTGCLNITPGKGRGSVEIGSISNVSGGSINIAGGDIHNKKKPKRGR